MSNTLSSVAEDLTFFGQEVLTQLQNYLRVVSTVNRNYRGAESAPGSIVQIPSIDISGDASTRSVQGAVTTSDLSSASVTVSMQQIYKAVAIDNLSKTFSNVDLTNEAAKRLAYLCAKKADLIVTSLWNKVPFEAGSTDGTAFFASGNDTDKLAEIRKILTTNQAPDDVLYFAMNPSEALAIRKLASYKQAYSAGDGGEGRRTGDLKPLLGFNLLETQQIQNATLSTTTEIGSPTSTAGEAVGSATLHLSGLASTAVIKAGTQFKHTASGFTYVATANWSAASGGVASGPIFPKIKSAVTTSDAFTGTGHSAAGSMNLAYHPDAILAVSRPQAAYSAGSGVNSVTVTDPQTGLSVRMSHQTILVGNPGMQEQIVADMLFGADVVRPEFIVKGTGIV